MTSWFQEVNRREAFFPTWLGVLLNPFFLARQGLAESMRRYAPKLNGQLLDVGCGTMPYRSLFAVDRYVGLEIDSERARRRGCADFYYDGTVFPFGNEEFDSVLCNQVLEHVFNPGLFLSEIFRVLKPNGRLLLTVPFVWDEHEQPFDYARYSSFGLRFLLEGNGFTVFQTEKTGSDASILFQLTNAYVYKVTVKYPKFVRIGLSWPLMALINILALLARRLLPDNPDLYLDQIVLAEKKV